MTGTLAGHKTIPLQNKEITRKTSQYRPLSALKKLIHIQSVSPSIDLTLFSISNPTRVTAATNKMSDQEAVEEAMGTSVNPRDQLVKTKSTTMEFFLESRNIDHVTEKMLRQYDKDGNGSFSKDEVVSIVIDLREESYVNRELAKYNKIYKQLLCVAVGFVILLLSGMFALSYTVAQLTMKTDVETNYYGDNALVKAGTHDIVSTDSRSEVHTLTKNEFGVLCTTPDEALLMKVEVEAGRNVAVVANDPLNDSQSVLYLNGGSTYTNTDGDFCWNMKLGDVICFQPHESCHVDNTQGRKLSLEEKVVIEQQYGKSLLNSKQVDRRYLEENGYGLVPQ